MKKILLFLILFFYWSEVSAISASSYIVMDQNSNQILYGSNYDSQSLIASITKIMTAIIVIENCELDEVVTVGDEVLKAYGSAVYIEVGEKLTVEDLLYGLMLRSGNDAATVLAYYVSGSLESFAVLMNEKVSELGLVNTTFYNPTGLDEETENISSAYDMAVITSYAMKNDVYAVITGTSSYVATSSYKTYSWENKNRLLQSTDYITGGKTGYTVKANRTLVTTATKSNADIVVVTLNDGNDFADHLELYELVFANYEAVKVVSKDVTSYENEENSYYVKNDYYALIKNDDEKNLTVSYEIYNECVGNVAGVISVHYYDELLYTDNIYVVSKTDESKLSFLEKIINWFKSW